VVERAEIREEALQADTIRLAGEVPVEAPLVGPLAVGRELRAHEEEDLPRPRVLVREEQPEVRELLPRVAGHLLDERALPVHDLVVGERVHEVLAVLVEHRERDLLLMVPAMDRIARQVAERVVHPAHVPLEREAEPARGHRLRDARPGRRLLRDRDARRLLHAHRLVQLAEEEDRLEVLAAAVRVREPLARLAAVVEVEHRRHGVDAEPVDVELAQPVERVRDEEAPHLVAAVVEDERAPVGVLAAARVLVLEERRAVEAPQREVVAGKVRRHPVEDHADARAMERVDEETEIVRACRSARSVRSSPTPGTPRALERMLRDRQQLDVGESEAAGVLREAGGDLAERQRPVALLGHPRPGAEVHLVDGDGLAPELVRRPRRHPGLVAPAVAVAPHHARGCARGRSIACAKGSVLTRRWPSRVRTSYL
jgi:hypothetical protein